MEGQITYDEQNKCFELELISNYCPSLSFGVIEPGTLRIRNHN